MCGFLNTCILRASLGVVWIFFLRELRISIDFSSLPIIWEDLSRKEVNVVFP